MIGLVGLAILLIFLGVILKVAAKAISIPDIVVQLLLLLLGFIFVYYILAVFGLLPERLIMIR